MLLCPMEFRFARGLAVGLTERTLETCGGGSNSLMELARLMERLALIERILSWSPVAAGNGRPLPQACERIVIEEQRDRVPQWLAEMAASSASSPPAADRTEEIDALRGGTLASGWVGAASLGGEIGRAHV